jgi:DNA helicase IV
MTRCNIGPSFLGRLIGFPRSVDFSSGQIIIKRLKKDVAKISLGDLIDFPEERKSWFWSTLSFSTLNSKIEVGYLSISDVRRHKQLIDTLVSNYLNGKIKIGFKLFQEASVDNYLRDSAIETLRQNVFVLVSKYLLSRKRWQESLGQQSIEMLDKLTNYSPIDKNLDLLRGDYENKILSQRSEFFDTIEAYPLTKEQRLAVVRENDRNLVLAAAGTGKTSVMVAKALDLIDRGKAKPEEILVLAYNNAAAKELRERLDARSQKVGICNKQAPGIMTFHALGRTVLREAGTTTLLSVFMDDPIKLEMWLSKWLVDYIKSSPKAMFDFIELSHQPVNPFGFNTKAEYEAHIRDNEFRTLQNERVRGYQELLIANWLFLNCIDYQYEAPYVTKRRIDIGFDYKPDFYLSGTNIYLEHFGISRDGRTAPGIDKEAYNESIKKKRLLHKEYGTVLLETYHYDWIENALEERLGSLMKDAGIKTQARPTEEVFKTLNEAGFVTEAAKRYLKCLQAIRIERLNKETIKERIRLAGLTNEIKHTELLWSIHEAYCEELHRQRSIDFDDMIIRAIEAIDNRKYKPKWTHVLVDEFQDISAARMELLKKIIEHGPDPRFTAVGDDWQSIYRFAGGKLELTTQFKGRVGSCSITSLEKTFRYNNSIAETAGTFVMRNPEQYRKNIRAHTTVGDPQVYLLDSKVQGGGHNQGLRTLQIVEKIRSNDNNCTIAILSRYRYILEDVKKEMGNQKINNIKFWTFHSAKGLEADYCILVGFFQGKSGFPNKNKDEAVVEALLPTLDDYPHSEERRLLYVALTRAKNKAYIIADPTAPSEFINELLSPVYSRNLSHLSSFRPPVFPVPPR